MTLDVGILELCRAPLQRDTEETTRDVDLQAFALSVDLRAFALSADRREERVAAMGESARKRADGTARTRSAPPGSRTRSASIEAEWAPGTVRAFLVTEAGSASTGPF